MALSYEANFVRRKSFANGEGIGAFGAVTTACAANAIQRQDFDFLAAWLPVPLRNLQTPIGNCRHLVYKKSPQRFFFSK